MSADMRCKTHRWFPLPRSHTSVSSLPILGRTLPCSEPRAHLSAFQVTCSGGW